MHIAVVVAWDDRHRGWLTEALEPRKSFAELVLKGKVGQVSGDHDVVPGGALEIRKQTFQNFAFVKTLAA